MRADAIAEAIRGVDGGVWKAIDSFGVSYRRALRIRSGWRPGGVTAIPIPHRSRGWISGRRPGWSAAR